MIDIIVNGKPITKYQHEGNTFVEGWKGSEYFIRLKKMGRPRYQLKAVVSVDGMNVISNNQEWDQGFILNGDEFVDVKGFYVDGKLKAFTFGDNFRSYSGSSSNAGVIGVMWFKEKDETQKISRRITNWDNDPFSAKPWVNPKQPWSNPVPYPYPGGTGDYKDKLTWMTSSGTVNVNNMQTIPGQTMNIDTTEVDFISDSQPFATEIIYYDSAQGLKNRGIIINKRVSSLPEAFPT